MDEYLSFAKNLAYQCGRIIKENAGSDVKSQLKSDHTPVTEVDKQINSLVIDAIHTTYPAHGVLGEEQSSSKGNEEYQWLCDPLDGTRAFILGVPVTTFILGLLRDGELQLAVVYDPFSDRLYHAVKGQGAFCNNQRIYINQVRLSEGGCVIVSETSFQFAPAILATGAQIEPLPGAGYRSMLVATGKCSASVQGGADFHDVGPASLIVEEAGGQVTDLEGRELKFDQPLTNGIILSNRVCHKEVLEAIA